MNEMKLDVTVHKTSGKNNLLAFANVKINDCFVVDGLKVMNGKSGIFTAMPSVKQQNGEYKDVCFPVTAEFRNQLNQAVLAEYVAEITKPSVTKEVQKNAAKVAAQPKKSMQNEVSR
jgi:stage V sporulation protein G